MNTAAMLIGYAAIFIAAVVSVLFSGNDQEIECVFRDWHESDGGYGGR